MRNIEGFGVYRLGIDMDITYGYKRLHWFGFMKSAILAIVEV